MVHRYSRGELLADGVIHALGVTLGVAGCAALAVLALRSADPLLVAGLAPYAGGLIAMLGCSALYHMTRHAAWKGRLRRLDHAAIFVMIAGTYTPFVLVLFERAWAIGLLAFVWAVAIGGGLVKVLCPRRFERLSIVAYLLLGWTVLVALDPLFAAMSTDGILLLAAGGVLYTSGVVFHLWTRLPYHNAIWHAFVLGGAALHYAAVVREVAAA